MAQILMDRQQSDPQVFDQFGIGGFIDFAGFVGVEADLGDFRRIAQEFPTFLGKYIARFRLTQPQAVQQALAPAAEAFLTFLRTQLGRDW